MHTYPSLHTLYLPDCLAVPRLSCTGRSTFSRGSAIPTVSSSMRVRPRLPPVITAALLRSPAPRAPPPLCFPPLRSPPPFVPPNFILCCPLMSSAHVSVHSFVTLMFCHVGLSTRTSTSSFFGGHAGSVRPPCLLNSIIGAAVFETVTHVYIVMELVTGGELFDRIVAKDHYSETEAASVFVQIIGAIDYIHR